VGVMTARNVLAGRRSGRHRSVRVWVTVLALAVGVAPAAADTTEPVTGSGELAGLVEAAMSTVDAARRDVDTTLVPLRAAMESGSLERALRGAYALEDYAVHPGVPAVSPVVVPGSVPAPVAAPIAALVQAVEAASQLTGEAVRPGAPLPDDEAVLSMMLAAEDAMDTIAAGAIDAAVGGNGAAPVYPIDPAWLARHGVEVPADAEFAAPDPRLTAFQRLEEQVDERIDVARVRAAGVVVARAVDAALPALHAYSTTQPGGGERVDGCDVVNRLPDLCVGSTANNVYTADARLLIDLGGNDVHRHGAGSVFVTLDRDNPNIPEYVDNDDRVSVTLDVAGNDTYHRQAESGPISLGQAVARGGVGMLVDGGGDDSYTVEAPKDLPGVARGQASASIGGVAMLADLAGRDSYFLDKGIAASGQATASLGATSVLLDGGVGDDSYRAEAVTNPQFDKRLVGFPRDLGAIMAAHGSGSAGAAVLADGGGNSTIVGRVSGVTPDRGTCGAPSPTGISICISYAGVQGNGAGQGRLGGSGVMLLGAGRTDLSLSAEGTGAPSGPDKLPCSEADVDGIGDGSAGFGAVWSVGGDTTYRLRASCVSEHRVDVDAGPADALARSGDQKLHEKQAAAVLEGMGYGQIGGVGVVRDDGGDDRYVSEASSVAVAEARERRDAAAGATGATARTLAAPVQSWTQGFGLLHGQGLIVDAAGNDRYRSTATSQAHASAFADDPRAPVHAYATAMAGSHFAQGGGGLGLGAVLDVGGVDHYTTDTVVSAVADPPTLEQADDPRGGSFVQAGGRGVAYLLDLDGSGTDVFRSTPYVKPAVGERGDAFWGGNGGTGPGGLAAATAPLAFGVNR
jgi:hypothetical protein